MTDNPSEKDSASQPSPDAVEGHAVSQLKRDANDAEGGNPLEDIQGHAVSQHKRDANDAEGGDVLEDVEGHSITGFKRDVNSADGGDPFGAPDRDAV
jgi:hypothetical protein